MLTSLVGGRHTYGLRRAPSLSLRAREILADGERIEGQSLRVDNNHPAQNTNGEGDVAVEAGTGSVEAESSNANADADGGEENERVSEQISEPEDSRNLRPTTWAESNALLWAIQPTALQYVGITGLAGEMPDHRDNYFSQWAFFQQRMNAYWAERGLISVPPRLVALDRWTGGIANWESAGILNSGTG